MPSTINGGFSSWRGDLIAGLSVALVALPLAMGIALASGYPPLSGILAAIVGGMLAFVLGGTHVGVKGPAAGTIVTLIAAMQFFGGPEKGIPYLLACTAAAGLLLLITGIFKFGRVAELVPTPVISGLLAAIGFIIVIKQVDEALGYTSTATTPTESLKEIPTGLLNINAVSLLISLVSILILLLHKRIPSKTITRIPAAIWVLLLSIPWVFVFDMQKHHELVLWIWDFYVGPELLVNLPSRLVDSILQPNLGMIGHPMFWGHAFSIYIILLVENLLSAKAVDKLDPLNRKTNLNRDLASSGFVTILSSLIGGMPSITVIVRSSVNINVGGRQRLSNFFHGLILLLFIFVAIRYISLIPKAALAAILLYTGYRLCSPRKFLEALQTGWEQLSIFVITFYATVNYSLLTGILVGAVCSFFLQYFLSGFPISFFWRSSRYPRVTINTLNDPKVEFICRGVFNFLGSLKIQNALNELPPGRNVVADFSHCRLIDSTIMEVITNFSEQYEKAGGSFNVVGLDHHHKSSPHPLSMHIMETVWQENVGLTKRQEGLKQWAGEHNAQFSAKKIWQVADLYSFPYISLRPPEYKTNVIHGKFPQTETRWELSDLYFHEGELEARQSFHTTMIRFTCKHPVPVFSLEEEHLYDRLRELAHHRDIHPDSEQLDRKFIIQGPEESEIINYFNGPVGAYLEKRDAFRIESNGHDLMVFRQLRFASVPEVEELFWYCEGLERVVNANRPGNRGTKTMY